KVADTLDAQVGRQGCVRPLPHAHRAAWVENGGGGCSDIVGEVCVAVSTGWGDAAGGYGLERGLPRKVYAEPQSGQSGGHVALIGKVVRLDRRRRGRIRTGE